MSTGSSNVSIASSAARLAATATNATTASATSTNDKSRKSIADNFDAFLSLLTTQLKNQSPLDPLDANQFTQQLVQFSGVEQQLKTNDQLAMLVKNSTGGSSTKLNPASAASLIGRRVSADASTQRLGKDANNLPRGEFPVTVPVGYSNFEVTIKNKAGQEVFKGPWRPAGTGEQVLTWDGRSSNGTAVDPAGEYTVSVTGQTPNGLKSILSTERSGIVTSVDLSGSEEMVQFGSYTLPLSRIKKVSSGV
jgi:flagellar basal-body rod modification protein FlgD